MPQEIRFTVNGTAHALALEPARPLLEVLREDLQLTGTKYGCGEGACRACTVLVNGRAVQSCLTPVSAMNGAKIETIESLASENSLHPVQQAFIECEGMQCGYCVPGMIMTTVALLRRTTRPDRAEIIEALNGNICRCCGYSNLLAAVERAANTAP